MPPTTRRRIATRASRTGFKPARLVRATPGLVVTGPDGAPISHQASSASAPRAAGAVERALRRWKRRRAPEPHRDHGGVVVGAEEDGLPADARGLASEPAAQRTARAGAEAHPAELRELPGREVGGQGGGDFVPHERQAEEGAEARDPMSERVGDRLLPRPARDVRVRGVEPVLADPRVDERT